MNPMSELQKFTTEMNEFFTNVTLCALYYEKKLRPANIDPRPEESWVLKVLCDICAVAKYLTKIDGEIAKRETWTLNMLLPKNIQMSDFMKYKFQVDSLKEEQKYVAQIKKDKYDRLPLSFKILINAHYAMYLEKKNEPDALQKELAQLNYLIGIITRILVFVAVADKKIYKAELVNISNFAVVFANEVSQKFGVPFSVKEELEQLKSFMLSVAKYKEK